MADSGFWVSMMLFGSIMVIGQMFLLTVTRYKRCASDEILVVYGRVDGGRAAKVIHGGAVMVWPMIQDYKKMSLVPMKIEVDISDALTNEGAKIGLPSTWTVAISTDPLIMNNAAERLLHLNSNQIEDLASEIILSQTRMVVGALSISEIIQEREKFVDMVNEEVSQELSKLGLHIVTMNINNIDFGENSNTGGANMGKERIDTGGKVFGPYSPGVKANGVIWLAGQIAPEAGGIREQTQASLDKIDALLAAAGATKHEVTFAQVLLDDINDFSDMNEIYGAWLTDVEIPPARAAFEAAALPRGAAVEIVVQAYDKKCCE